MQLPVAGQAARRDAAHDPAQFRHRLTVSAIRAGSSAGSPVSISNAHPRRCRQGRSTMSRARRIEVCRRTMSATCSGCTNMPRTLVVWSAAAEPSSIRWLVRPHGLGTGQQCREVAGGETDQRVFRGSASSPRLRRCRPGATGLPVPGTTSSRMIPSSSTMPGHHLAVGPDASHRRSPRHRRCRRLAGQRPRAPAISARSDAGRASAPTSAFFSEETSIPSLAPRSSRIFRKDGVPT
mgnify:CR=1 FL=1